MAADSNLTKSYWTYTSDAEVPTGGSPDIRRGRFASYITAQKDNAGAGNTIVGGAASNGTEPKLWSGGKLRRAIMRDNTNFVDRVVVVMEHDAPLIIQPPANADSHTLSLNRPKTQVLGTYKYGGQYLTETRGRRA